MVRARPRSDRSVWRAALRSEAHGATACLRGSRLTTLTPKDFLRIGSHREILCLAIQHDKGPQPAFPLVRGLDRLSQQSAPGGIRTPNLLIRNQMLYPLSYGRSAATGSRCATSRKTTG